MSATNNTYELLQRIEKAVSDIRTEVMSIKGKVAQLESQFKQQFAPVISEQDIATIENDFHQTSNSLLIFILSINYFTKSLFFNSCQQYQ